MTSPCESADNQKPDKSGRVYPRFTKEDIEALTSALPTLIRHASPHRLGERLVSVQPMTGPVGGIAFYRPRYGRKKTPLQEFAERVWADEDETDDASNR